ncbi:adenylate/guanylate cyclase domain-containing protein [Dongia soli]|uniref:Adenylate/guanylate cyclase domain-containing protein n=1 Tax=Dongia soli TaxID=600628 RepID=A0ABU5EDY5_9PROT|nr:adenylate/guanylate cyclase domain-containing protein [Dongia soli]MDY0884564.1 adenylate/guanylate cyclase domain-containing protein [Dongia soli]
MLENLIGAESETCNGLGRWLAREALERRDLKTLFSAFCNELRRRDLPLWRGQLGLEVLHPEQVGIMLVWKDDNLTVRDAQRSEVMQSPDYTNSPTRIVDETNETFRRRLDRPSPDIPLLEDLRQSGATDYVMIPLPFLEKRRTAVVSFATQMPDGFTERQIDDLKLAALLFSPYAERHVLRRLAVDLLDIYIGPRSGERITDGQIELGQVEHIQAAIWLADMRGFTRFSEEASIADVIQGLNSWLKPMVAVIENHGGEVLKFIGDAVLAIFPIMGDEKGIQDTCGRALSAAREFGTTAVQINEARRMEGLPPLDYGLVLHVGEVAYGNIGAPTRLDFTVIGPAVNRAARLQELTKQLGQRLLVSETFADTCSCKLMDLGHHVLRDIDGEQRIFAVDETE